MIEVERDGELDGVFWFSPVWDNIIEIHIAARPEARGRWLTRSVMATARDTIIEHTGCKYCIAQIVSPLLGRIASAVGFKLYPGFAIFDVEEQVHGRNTRGREGGTSGVSSDNPDKGPDD